MHEQPKKNLGGGEKTRRRVKLEMRRKTNK
jgi:hypothetical protein